jgi:hypothetical protein
VNNPIIKALLENDGNYIYNLVVSVSIPPESPAIFTKAGTAIIRERWGFA